MKRAVFATVLVIALINLVLPPTLYHQTAIAEDEQITIVFDFSHGQNDYYSYDIDLKTTLESNGYNVVWAIGGLNSTILENATALMLGCVKYSYSYSANEVVAVANWFNQGGKFLWVGGDSDYNNLYIFNEEVYKILESVRSHVYPEQAIIQAEQNCVGNQAAKVIANITTQNPMFQSIVANVTDVLMAGGTTLYGSDNENPTHELDPVNLESNNITDVYPLLYYNPTAYVKDNYLPHTLVHSDLQIGAFVAITLEDNAGCSGNGVLVVSGTPTYGEYEATCWTEYWSERILDGQLFITQLIDFCVDKVNQYSTRPASTLCPQTTPNPTTTTIEPTTEPTGTTVTPITSSNPPTSDLNQTTFDGFYLTSIAISIISASIILVAVALTIRHKTIA